MSFNNKDVVQTSSAKKKLINKKNILNCIIHHEEIKVQKKVMKQQLAQET